MDKRNFAFDKSNFILLAVGMAIVFIGFILLSGGSSDENTFDPTIFDTRHIVVAPTVCLFGFLFIIYAVAHKPKDNGETALEVRGEETDLQTRGEE